MAYTSKNGKFASTSQFRVEEFDSLNLNSKFDFSKRLAIKFMAAGHCPMAEEFYSDYCKGFRAGWDLEKELKRGDYNLFRVEKSVREIIDKTMEALGYEHHNVFVGLRSPEYIENQLKTCEKG